ncbi:putative DNA binding domain-containing protein [candidate division KSB1 bacterium]|nr:putative DNA binding domain-containing protein [candidate division KSB1 bacterium]
MAKKSSDEIIDLIIEGTSEKLEFCEESLDDETIARHIVSFANAKGGILLFGVDEKKEVHGLNFFEIEHRITDITANMVYPAISPEYYNVKLTGKTVGVVDIQECEEKPYYYIWKGEQNYVIRSKKACRKIPPNQIQQMRKKAGSVRNELTPVGNATLADLDPERIHSFLMRSRFIDYNNLPEKEKIDLLELLEIISRDGKKIHPTTAGLLLFGHRPEEFLAHTKIDVLVFSGEEKSQDSLIMAASSPFIAARDPETGDVTRTGVVEEILGLISNNQEDEDATFPEDVLKELLVNALVHRDYLLTDSKITIEIYSHHIDIYVPGNLFEGQTVSKIKAGMKLIRNPLLYTFMAEAEYFNKNILPVYKLLYSKISHPKIKKFEFEPQNQQVRVSLSIK